MYPSVCNGSLVFSDFLYEVRGQQPEKQTELVFPGKFLFSPKCVKMAQNGPKGSFRTWNDLKRKSLWLGITLHDSQNSGSRVSEAKWS